MTYLHRNKKATVGCSADSTFPPKRSECLEFIFSDFIFNNDTGTDLPFCLEDGCRADSVGRELKRTLQGEDSTAVRKVRDICGNLLGEGGSQMSNFLTSAVRARHSRVNHDVPLKDYM